MQTVVPVSFARRWSYAAVGALLLTLTGCGTGGKGGCDYQVESIALGGAMLDKHAGEGETVDKDLELWVCKNGQLVRVNQP